MHTISNCWLLKAVTCIALAMFGESLLAQTPERVSPLGTPFIRTADFQVDLSNTQIPEHAKDIDKNLPTEKTDLSMKMEWKNGLTFSTVDDDFRVYRRNRNEPLLLIHP